MIRIAFCFEQESILEYVRQEVLNGFNRRGIIVQILTAHHPDDLLLYDKQQLIPDILLFSNSNQSKKLLNTILFLKNKKPSMISIFTRYSDSCHLSMPEDLHLCLQPFFDVSISSSHELWNYMCKAYDLSICDKDTFAYYHRPGYRTASLNHILYFSSEGRCVRLVTDEHTDSFYGRLGELEESLTLKNCRFIRIHQSYLVNTQFIASYNHKRVLLLTGEELNISKPVYYQKLKKILSLKSDS